jgi:periplasmic divalent cation tolerance protein
VADEIIQVVTTTADKEDAEMLAQALLTKRLAGCVQVSGPITSSYWWNNRLEHGTEFTCIIKTIRSLYPEVEQTLLELHPYDQPEILAVAVSDVSPGYAQWLREQVKPLHPVEPTETPVDSTTDTPAAETPWPAAEASLSAEPAPATEPTAAPKEAPEPSAPAATTESEASATAESQAKSKRAPKKKSPKPSA